MSGFTWQDGERTIHFGRGRIAEAGELLPDGYELLTTERAQGDAPHLVEAAAEVQPDAEPAASEDPEQPGDDD